MSNSNLNKDLFPHQKQIPDNYQGVYKCGSGDTLIESTSSGIFIPPKLESKEVSFGNAIRILKKPSRFTSDTLYDHLVEVIKRIIDERPPNVIDYFELFSRDVRHRKDRFSGDGPSLSTPLPEPEFVGLAKDVLKSLRLGSADLNEDVNEGLFESHLSSPSTDFHSSVSSITKIHRTLSKAENVVQLQQIWAFCGLGFQIDEVFQLSWAVQKIQTHRGIRSARFWGRIFGRDASYYIVEAEVTRTERLLRMDDMEVKLVQDMVEFIKRKLKAADPPDVDPELVPGYDCSGYPEDVVTRMQVQVAPVPVPMFEECFEMPPEPVGTGLNRKAYFVTRALSEEWQELPIVTPKQIVTSTKIRKFFTGHLETKLSSYPPFPGTEANYLRAMIARITAGTYIAPNGYFRKMTRKERFEVEHGSEVHDFAEGEEDELDDSDIDEDDIVDNDWPTIEDESYQPQSVKDLKFTRAWVHCRPHILKQGTIDFIDEEGVIKNLTKVALRKMRQVDEMDEGGEEIDPESEDEAEFEEDEDERPDPETGPELFASTETDRNSEQVCPWSSRCSEYCTSTNQAVVMRSNLWPGAYSFICGNICDSIYIGWGTKYVARCGVLDHLPEIQSTECPDDILEASDPTVEMEERWRLCHETKEFRDGGEEISFGIETDNDDEDEGGLADD